MNKTIITITLIVALGITVFFMYNIIKEKNTALAALQLKVANIENLYSSAASQSDSLNALTGVLSSYKILTYSMLYRDSIRKSLKYSVGNIVYLKSDSSRAVVKDIIVGGGKFEHYIKYEVLRKDNSSQLLAPELVY